MTAEAKQSWFRWLSLVGAVMTLAYFFMGMGENRNQIDQSREDINRLQQAISTEINRATELDASSERQEAVILTRLEEILRRLDRIERKVSP